MTRYADRAEAREAIADRDVYGAIVASRGEATLLTAPAASPAVAQLLEQRLGAGSPTGAPGDGAMAGGLAVVEVVAGSPDDPRGAGFSASILPLILIGLATGALGWVAGGGVARSLAFLLGASALAGVVTARAPRARSSCWWPGPRSASARWRWPALASRGRVSRRLGRAAPAGAAR